MLAAMGSHVVPLFLLLLVSVSAQIPLETNNVASSCNSHYNAGRTSSGYYKIALPFAGVTTVYCHMETSGGWTLAAVVSNAGSGTGWAYTDANGNAGQLSSLWESTTLTGTLSSTTHTDNADYKSNAYNYLQGDSVMLRYKGTTTAATTTNTCLGQKSLKDHFNSLTFDCAGGSFNCYSSTPSCTGSTRPCTHRCTLASSAAVSENFFTGGQTPQELQFKAGEANGAQDNNKDRAYLAAYPFRDHVDAPNGLGSYSRIGGSESSFSMGIDNDASVRPADQTAFYHIYVQASSSVTLQSDVVDDSCNAHFEAGRTTSGYYLLDLSANGGANGEPVYCDMRTGDANPGGWTLVGVVSNANPGTAWAYSDANGNQGDVNSLWESTTPTGVIHDSVHTTNADFKSPAWSYMDADRIMIKHKTTVALQTVTGCVGDRSLRAHLNSITFDCATSNFACYGSPASCNSSLSNPCTHWCGLDTGNAISGDDVLTGGSTPTRLHIKTGEANGAQDTNKDRVYFVTFPYDTNVHAVAGLGAYTRLSSSVHTFSVSTNQDASTRPADTSLYYQIYVQAKPPPCVNNPLDAAPSPVMSSNPTLNNNNYEFAIQTSASFNSVKMTFDDSPTLCDYDSTTGDANGWTTTTDYGSCVRTHSFSKAVQTVISSQTGGCAFTRSDTSTEAVFSKRITVTTDQTRTIGHVQGHRNQTYNQIKHTEFLLRITVPLNVAVTSGQLDVTGNITVLQAVSQLAVAFGDPYKVSFSVITSSQAPYELTYDSFTSSSDLGNSATVNSGACADPAAAASCVQQFTFSDIDITTTCGQGKTRLNNEAMTITYNVGCKASYTGNCITPEPAQITASFTLTSREYCPQTNAIGLSATLTTFRDESLTDTNSWTQSTSQFVIGSTLYGEATVTVDGSAATLVTTKINSINTIGQGTVSVYRANDQFLPNALGTTTGAQLDAKVTAGDAFYMAGSHSVQGDDLIFSNAPGLYAAFVRMPYVASGALNADDTVTLEVVFDSVIPSGGNGDNDPVLGFCDGTTCVLAGIADNDAGSATAGYGTISGNTYSAVDHVSIATGWSTTGPYNIKITLHSGGSTVTIRNAAGVSASRTMTHTFNVANAQDVRFFGNDAYESYQIKQLSIIRAARSSGGTEVENGDVANHGSADWSTDNEDSRFAIPLEHDSTVDLTGNLDAAQALTIQVGLDVTFTAAGATGSPMLQEWDSNHHGRTFITQESATYTASASVGVLSAPTVGGAGGSGSSASSSSSGIAGMSTMTVAAVCGAFLLLVVLAAYKFGVRTEQTPKGEEDIQLTSVTSTTSIA